MKLVRAFVLLSLDAAAVHAKPRSSISSLEEFWIFIGVVYAAVLVPLLAYFLYSIVSDPATGQVLTVMWARMKQQTVKWKYFVCTKPYKCHCTKCGHQFTQNVQKDVDDAISLKLLTLTLVNEIERVILFNGDGNFHGSLGHVRNVLRRVVWAVGFWGTVSGDLQQLASRVIWVNDLWGRIQHQGRRERRTLGRCRQLESAHLDEKCPIPRTSITSRVTVQATSAPAIEATQAARPIPGQ
ncbi:hypothetical protein PHYPSEUDO_014603 [Phytophthora pseudosyringae]|uniref:Uncharacterized protein n=1 Tax=Phytophthora pseudosyringae TaxID=221518 RepID=A0A8T1W1K0_9STRA|nr:hypothetical protein PHYPSEUDO_014603 [Phytophthora pseudosyringae]